MLAYRGHRGTEQFQAIPTAPQASPLHPGGVIGLGRDYWGTDLRWTHRARLLDGPLTLVAGLAYDALQERRRGWQNFVGTQLGVQGALRRDENNDVSNFDQYVQATWRATPRWTVNAGVRHSQVRFTSRDNYVTAANPDDSGSTSYGATLPAVGVAFAVTPDFNVYAAAGRGFETPTLNELAYRPGGLTGLNLGLQAARSRSYEVGAKARSAVLGDFTAAAFLTGTEDEIVTATNTGGRATFRNAGDTRRTGVELGWNRRWAGHLRAQAAYTFLDARYRDGFAGVPADNRIPGLARHSLYAALGWMPPAGWRAGVEAARPRRRAGQRRQQRRRRAPRGGRRPRRLRARRRAVGPRRLRARRQPDRPPLRRLGDRQRGQRALLRAGAGAHLAGGRLGDAALLSATRVPAQTPPPRYGRVASLLHWIVGLAVIGQIAFGFLLDDIAPRGTPSRGAVINLHKSVGIALGVLVVLRLAWRLGHRLPDWPASMPAQRRRLALHGHRALYACLLVAPLAGYLASNFSKHGVKFFGLALRPWGPDLPAVYTVLNGVHVGSAWLLAALVAGHVAIALKHALVDRDGSLARISPWGRR